MTYTFVYQETERIGELVSSNERIENVCMYEWASVRNECFVFSIPCGLSWVIASIGLLKFVWAVLFMVCAFFRQVHS